MTGSFVFATDHVTLLSRKLVDWLRYASITQGGGASAGGFFTGPRSRQVSKQHSHRCVNHAARVQLFLSCVFSLSRCLW